MGDRLGRNVSTVHICLDFPSPLPVATSPPAVGYIGLPMHVLRPLLVCALRVWPSWGATFGTVVPHTQPLADLVLDEARKRIYLAALAVVGRARPNAATSPHPGTAGVVLAK